MKEVKKDKKKKDIKKITQDIIKKGIIWLVLIALVGSMLTGIVFAFI